MIPVAAISGADRVDGIVADPVLAVLLAGRVELLVVRAEERADTADRAEDVVASSATIVPGGMATVANPVAKCRAVVRDGC